MLTRNNQIRKLATFTGVLLAAAAEALAQDRVSRQARRIVVSIPDRKLAVLEGDQVLHIFPTAVGATRTPSPAGSYRIIERIPHPTWYGKGKVVAPGAGNPLGTRWLGLSIKGYGIHGTNAPSSVGHRASHGCIRMRNRDVEQLFEMVRVGDAVELVDERTAEVEQIFGDDEVASNGVVAAQ